LPSSSNVKKTTDAVKFSVAQDNKMVINKKDYGSKGQMLKADFQGSYYRGETATFSYDLNAQYSTLTLGIGLDDQSWGTPTRTLTFMNQDGIKIKQMTIGKGSVEEGIVLNVKGIVRLDIEVSNLEGGLSYIDLISPILTK
jgi:hypothetical protein